MVTGVIVSVVVIADHVSTIPFPTNAVLKAVYTATAAGTEWGDTADRHTGMGHRWLSGKGVNRAEHVKAFPRTAGFVTWTRALECTPATPKLQRSPEAVVLFWVTIGEAEPLAYLSWQ